MLHLSYSKCITFVDILYNNSLSSPVTRPELNSGIYNLSAMNGYQFSVDSWWEFKVQNDACQSPNHAVLHAVPRAIISACRAQADCRYEWSVLCISGQTSPRRGLDRLQRKGGGFSASSVIQLTLAAALPSSSRESLQHWRCSEICCSAQGAAETSVTAVDRTTQFHRIHSNRLTKLWTHQEWTSQLPLWKKKNGFSHSRNIDNIKYCTVILDYL